MRFYLLLMTSFLTLNFAYSMDDNGADIESSDSEIEDKIYRVSEPGDYYVLMHLLYRNRGTQPQKTFLAIRVNNKTIFKKSIVVDPSSFESLYAPIILKLDPYDAIEFDFGDNDDVEVAHKQIEYVLIPKNSSVKG